MILTTLQCSVIRSASRTMAQTRSEGVRGRATYFSGERASALRLFCIQVDERGTTVRLFGQKGGTGSEGEKLGGVVSTAITGVPVVNEPKRVQRNRVCKGIAGWCSYPSAITGVSVVNEPQEYKKRWNGSSFLMSW